MGEDRSKFNVNKNKEQRTYDDIVFDSVIEMAYYRDIVLPAANSGDIKHFELQKSYELQPKFTYDGKTVKPIVYVADFYIEYANGRCEVIDVKGHPDSLALMKRKMFWYRYPDIVYRWICFSKIDGGWCDYDEVKTARAKRKKEKQAAKAAKEEKEN